MEFYDSDVPGPNPLTVRLFARERGGLTFTAYVVALSRLENRRKPYRDMVNPRGEVPALRLDDGTVLTEITAICEYLDEIASGGASLIGTTPAERAFTRSWTRWVDLEIAQNVVHWWRGSPDAQDFYRGNRVIFHQGREELRSVAERGLNALDDHLEGRDYICNATRPMLADVLLFAFLRSMEATGSWINHPGRLAVARWFARMAARPAVKAAAAPFKGAVQL